MSLPALARTFQQVETTLRLEQPTVPTEGVVLSFSLAQINGLVKDVIAKAEDIRATVVSATATARSVRTEKPVHGAAENISDLRDLDIAISVDDLIAMMAGLGVSLGRVSLSPIIEALKDAAPKLAIKSSEERRYVRRLASRVADFERRFVLSRARFVSEVELLAPYLRSQAKAIVAEALTHQQLETRNFEALPMPSEPDYRALRQSISRRFGKTLARLAE